MKAYKFRKSIMLFVVAVVFAMNFSTVSYAKTPKVSKVNKKTVAKVEEKEAEPSETELMVSEVISLVNKEREEAGLSALVVDEVLTEDAVKRANEISVKFSHTRPNGKAWYTLDPDNMYGENLAKGYSTAENTFKAWMNSKSHRDNIMLEDFTKVGAALYISEDGEYHWVLEFCYDL